VEVKRCYAAPLLARLLERKDISTVDKGLIHELVYGVLRWRRRLDWVAESSSRRPLEDVTSWIRNILRLGLYQLLFTQKIPPSAAVNESVKLAYRYGHRGTAAFVNAVLRQVQRCYENISFPDPKKDLIHHMAVFYSHPDWLTRRWVEHYGWERTIRICLANNTPPSITIRTNTLLTTRMALKQALEWEGVNTNECSLAPEGLRIHSPVPISRLSALQKGWFLVQDESSILVGYFLAPHLGDRVLDACAGLGGKTTHLAQLMRNQGEIQALDVNSKRLDILEETCRRLRVNIVRTQVRDVAELKEELGKFDAVLVDAPCSGLGVTRRHPEAKWIKQKADLAFLQKHQLRLLRGVQGCLKPGAVLVYGVCSHEPEEGQDVIRQFLDEYPHFELEDIRDFLPEDKTNWENNSKSPYFLSLPSLSHHMDGFFAARLRRR